MTTMVSMTRTNPCKRKESPSFIMMRMSTVLKTTSYNINRSRPFIMTGVATVMEISHHDSAILNQSFMITRVATIIKTNVTCKMATVFSRHKWVKRLMLKLRNTLGCLDQYQASTGPIIPPQSQPERSSASDTQKMMAP